MALPLLTRRVQLCAFLKASAGAFGSTTTSENLSAVILANKVVTDIYEPKFNPTVDLATRDPARSQITRLPSVVAGRYATITYGVEVKGTGSPGEVPLWADLFQACGMSKTVTTGSAVIGTVYANVTTGASNAQVPTIAGTFGTTKSGLMTVTITGVVTDTSITFTAIFYPSDGTTPTAYTAQAQTSATAFTLSGGALANVTVDFGDPDASTAGYVVGYQYQAAMTSSSQEDVAFNDLNTTSSFKYVDLGLIQDGRLILMKNCMGSYTGTMNRQGWGRFDFTFMGSIAEDVDPFISQALLAAIPYDDITPDPFVGVDASINSAEPACFSEFKFDSGIQVAMIPCASDPSGYDMAMITGRAPTGSIDPQAVLFSVVDYHQQALDGDVFPFSIQYGEAGNGFIFSARYAQFTNIPENADRDGILVDTLNMQFNAPNYDAGDDYTATTISIF